MTTETSRVPDRLVERYPAAVTVAAVSWVIALSISALLALPTTAARVQAVDEAVHRLVVANEFPGLVALGEVFSVVGSARVMVPVIFGVALILMLTRRWRSLWVWLAAIGFSQVFNGPVKELFARERPPLSIVETRGFAFPSGHAVTGAAVALALIAVLAPSGRSRRALEVASIVYLVVMAWSRVYVRAHWLSDGVAGAAFGAAAAITAALVVDAAWARRRSAG